MHACLEEHVSRMIHESFASSAGLALAMALTGFAFGLVYFAALRRTVVGVAAGNGWLFLLALTLGRYGAAAIFLALVARLGAIPLLVAFLGFLAARAVALHAAR
jgi:N-ATPase, AtpR subunit